MIGGREPLLREAEYRMLCDRVRQVLGSSKLPATRSVCANKFRVAKLADCTRSILFATRPKIAAGKPHKHGRTTGLSTLPLEGVIHLFDGVGH